MIITSSNLEALQRGFNKRFQAAYELYASSIWWPKLATEIPSTTLTEEYGWLDDLPALREWIGERAVQNLREMNYTLKNKDFELTLRVERNKIEDDKLGMYGPQSDFMGMKAAKKPDELVAAVLAAGETELCYDGQPFFNANHPKVFGNAAAGVQSNLRTGSALNAANYEAGRAQLRKIVGASGQPLGLVSTKLVVPAALEGTAKRIVQAEYLAGGESNINKGTAEVLVIPELTSDTDWYLMDDRLPIKPFLFQNRQAPRFDALFNRLDQNVFWSKQFVYGVDMRANAGYGLWFLAQKNKA